MFGRRIDHTEDFERVSLPILVVHGQQDPIFTPRAAEQFREIIPQAQISSYPCAHAPFYECAESFNLELVQLMNDVSQSVMSQRDMKADENDLHLRLYLSLRGLFSEEVSRR